MRAAVLSDSHRFDVVDVDDPTPAPGELVLRVDACGICGSDLKAYHALPPGTVLGHEFCGEVVGVGSGVREHWREGQAAAAMPLTACGRCRWCLNDEPAHCDRFAPVGLGGSPGAFAEYVRVDAASTVALADGIGEFGALVEPLAVGMHTVASSALASGDRVLVLGGGNVGAAVSTFARRMGAAEVVVSDLSASRRDTAALFGATGVHDPADGPPPTGFDVVFECVGAPGMIQAAIDASTVRGRVVVAGVCMVPDSIVPIATLMSEIDLRFAVYYRGKEFAAAADLLASGGIDPAPFVSSRVGLDGVDGAFERLLSTTTERKVLVTPSQ